MTITTLVLVLTPFINAQIYQRPYFNTGKEWQEPFEKLISNVDIKRGAMIIGENSHLNPEIVNVAINERYEANLDTIYRPDFQGTIRENGEYVSDATKTYNEIQRWLENKLLGSVNDNRINSRSPAIKRS